MSQPLNPQPNSPLPHLTEPRPQPTLTTASLSRRGLLALGAAAAASLAVARNTFSAQPAAEAPGAIAPPPPAPPSRQPERVLRLAHLTDFHIQPQLRGDQGVTACLAHMMQHKPELILTGGDHVMDVFARDAGRATELSTLYHKTMKDNTGLRAEACIGNHDIWGWHKSKSKTTGEESNWGKNWSLENLRIDKRYRTFDLAGWRFVILDTVQINPTDANGYVGGLDDEQFNWLAGLLKETPATMPVLVMSHIPIIHAGSIVFSGTAKPAELSISGGVMCLDNKRIIHLFSKHPNVKVSLSGHLHSLERLDMQGVSYICSGAVSGHWWEGRPKKENLNPHMARCDEGYAVMDLFADGTFSHSYHTYGWKA